MAVCISYRNESQWANNFQFPVLVDFALETADEVAQSTERVHVEALKRWKNEVYWPGRDVDIESDFPGESERKFWSRVFYEVARRIFTRQLGNQEYDFWQTHRISQAYRIGWLFEQAAQEFDTSWTAVTTDRLLFDRHNNTQQ